MLNKTPFRYQPPSGELEFLHVDDDLLLVSKPAGLLSVPGKTPDLADCLEARAKSIHPQARIVHRLDMATSGIMVMAMNAQAHRHLGLQFERRHVKKSYIAICFGEIEAEKGEINLPLRCDWPNRPLQMVDHELGKSALTKWRVLERKNGHTRVELTPHTGRSHQLRVHLKELGYPILGDEFYAHDDALAAADRLMLHAEKLTLFHPVGGAIMDFIDPCEF